jgi:hypothetical protein
LCRWGKAGHISSILWSCSRTTRRRWWWWIEHHKQEHWCSSMWTRNHRLLYRIDCGQVKEKLALVDTGTEAHWRPLGPVVICK